MANPVTFNYMSWVTRFPEFANVGEPLATEYFLDACIMQRNDGGSAISNDATALRLLNLLTAHIAWLNAPRDSSGNPAASGGAASPIVGRVNSASEGSVSVGSENNYPPGSAQWFQQTKYGAEWYALTNQYRRMRYFPGPQRVFNPPPPFATLWRPPRS